MLLGLILTSPIMATATTLTRHDQMVQGTADWLVSNDFDVLATDHIDDGRPCSPLLRRSFHNEREGHRPDIVAMKGGVRFLFEVEEEHTFNKQETTDQLTTFAADVRRDGGRCFLVVPQDAARVAEFHLSLHGPGGVEVLPY